MADIIKFPSAPFTPKDDEGSWGSGEAHCMQCAHEWAAVAPVGTVFLECPQCKSEKGVYKYKWAVPEGTAVWACACGNQLFYMTPEGHFCPNCGIYQQY